MLHSILMALRTGSYLLNISINLSLWPPFPLCAQAAVVAKGPRCLLEPFCNLSIWVVEDKRIVSSFATNRLYGMRPCFKPLNSWSNA